MGDETEKAKLWKLSNDTMLEVSLMKYLRGLSGFKFKHALETLRKEKTNLKSDALQKLIQNTFLNNISNLHPFVIDHRGPKEEIIGDYRDTEIDLPFQTCSFEMTGDFLQSVLPLPRIDYSWQKEVEEGGDIPTTLIPVILIHEVSPRRYYFMALEAFDSSLSLSAWEEDASNGYEGLRATQFVAAALRSYLEQDAGILTPKPYIKAGAGRYKGTIRPRDVVFIGNKKSPVDGSELPAVNIEWTHKWEVRGHWRSIAGVGKNRDGEYSVSGHTWVVPHVKGDGPLIKKTRVISATQHGEVASE